jgi:hypothetical protein
MTCADIIGRWIESILVVDTSDDILVDPPMRIFTVADGTVKGRFTGDHVDFDVNCRTNGQRTTIDFTRTHTDGTTTTYEGRVVSFGSRGVGVIRGRFVRNMPALLAEELNLLTSTNGDWETEKPT